ncbi:CCN family member 1-like [Hemiscyllium ocellatum]|uniref:CCN family member 1-like n=1 Tax=Hemiscyllium ocellatum TaxID=170820 RepID=UPI002966B38F|nr:CCN family member 1-like [Hemiscyllium ocellatum]
MERLVFLSLLLPLDSLLLPQVRQQCPGECKCPPRPGLCPPGVSLLFDGCGCCRVCARQLNDDCSLQRPCDHLKGLECNQGAGVSEGGGICRASSEGRTCEYNGRIYQHGEPFQPNCKHQCACIDGAVGCIPLCPQQLPLTGGNCPRRRLVKVPGQCCETFVCDREEPKPQGAAFHQLVYRAGISSRELIQNKHHSRTKQPALFGGQRFPRHRCTVQTTQWSECSKSCGLGVSTRVSNDNPGCKLKEETRLCQIRGCGHTFSPKLKKGKCTRTQRAMEPVRFTCAACKSVKQYQPISCGLCTDQRCCSPRKTRTIRVQFYCEDGQSYSKNMMMIQSCKCSYDCPHLNQVIQPSFRLNNDIHRFLD